MNVETLTTEQGFIIPNKTGGLRSNSGLIYFI